MKTKKSGIYAALTAAVLIIMAILITTCLEPLPIGNLEKLKVFPEIPENFVPAPGKGVVQFVIADEIKGRLIKPDVTTSAGFSEFDLYIYNNDGTTPDTFEGDETQFIDAVVTSQPIRLTSTTKPLELPANSYFFKLDAYQYDTTPVPSPTNCCVDCDGNSATGLCDCVCCDGGTDCESCSFTIPGGTVAATGVSLLTPVAVNTTNPVDVTLEAIGVSGTGDGRFNYTFTIAGLTTADLTISSLTGGSGSASKDLTIPSGNTGFIVLPADYYLISLEMGQSGFQTAYYTETLYIYEGMTSTFNNKPLPVLRNVSYNVSFTFSDGRSPDPIAGTTTHGTVFGPATDPGTFLNTNGTFNNPSHFNPALGLIFNGWYPTLGDVGTPALKIPDTFVFITNALTFYAGWTAGTSLTFNLDYTPASGIEPIVTISGSVLGSTLNQSQASGNILFTVTNDSLYSGFTWYTSVEELITGENTNIFNLIIDNSADGVKYKAIGDFYVTVRAIHIDTSLPVEKEIKITVSAAP